MNIVSLEDPVEYFVAGINQSQVRPEIGYDFASGLRQILRQDPDIIMVGEIRDDETAGLAVQAALTGHVVLSTLHTNNAPASSRASSTSKWSRFFCRVTQSDHRPAPCGHSCPDCKKPEEAVPEVQKTIKTALEGLPTAVIVAIPPPYQIYHAKGCATCKGRGISDEPAFMKRCSITKELEEVMTTGVTTQKITELAKKQGMITLRQDGIVKALKGVVSIEEIIRETEEA